jgi:predicted TIM-barrel fold metal-dependent hydrolase
MRDLSGIDVESMVAVDVHVHLHPIEMSAVDRAAGKYFGESGATVQRDALADYYRSRKIACVVFAVDERLTGRSQVTNDEVAAFAAEHADIAIAFASIDPTRGPEAVREARRLVASGGIHGLKLHPPLQQFSPNDPIAYPLYEVFAEAGLPVLFHTGHSGIGSGMPIILAHPSFPWQDEAISMCLHKPTIYIDLSGWSPKYFSPTLLQYANTLLKHKVLFGSDYPLITPDRWLADFEKISIRDEVRPLILKENARRLFGLGGPV